MDSQHISVNVKIGNALDILKTMPSESVDMCITSPPYWGLRDYHTKPLIWDEKAYCDHEWDDSIRPRKPGQVKNTINPNHSSIDEAGKGDFGQFCIKCGAWKGSLGLEPDPVLYIQHLIQIFDEVKRVIKKEGTCWVNLGDTYGGNGYKGNYRNQKYPEGRNDQTVAVNRSQPEKSLLMIPSRFAIAMIDHEWILRNDIILKKDNCMPQSVTDRFTVDFEHIFFLVKNKKYYFEQQLEEAISKPGRIQFFNTEKSFGGNGIIMGNRPNRNGRLPCIYDGNRNKRCVWSINTVGYSGGHYATFSDGFIKTPILAGCPEYGTVLDPFGGSGTTAIVSRKLNRSSIIIELNEEYKNLIAERLDHPINDIDTTISYGKRENLSDIFGKKKIQNEV